MDSKKKQLLIKNKLQKFFNNRLIIIDEIHNIRQSKDNSNKLVSNELMKLENKEAKAIYGDAPTAIGLMFGDKKAIAQAKKNLEDLSAPLAQSTRR
jgi:hypothetical protein